MTSSGFNAQRLAAVQRAMTQRAQRFGAETVQIPHAEAVRQRYGGRLALVLVEKPLEALPEADAHQLVARLVGQRFAFGSAVHLKPFMSHTRLNGVPCMQKTAVSFGQAIEAQTTVLAIKEPVIEHADSSLSLAKIYHTAARVDTSTEAPSFIGVIDHDDFNQALCTTALTGNAVLMPVDQRLAQWRPLVSPDK